MAFFTEDEVNRFKEHGFIRKPGVVDRMLLEKAADRFYEAMGVDRNDPKTFINAGPPSQNLKAGLEPDVRATLSESPIQEMCEDLVGRELVVQNHTFAKPVYPTGRPKSEWSHPEHGHLDGYTRPGVVHSFTVGVTVNINDVEPRSGAFTVWPGTHRRAMTRSLKPWEVMENSSRRLMNWLPPSSVLSPPSCRPVSMWPSPPQLRRLFAMSLLSDYQSSE